MSASAYHINRFRQCRLGIAATLACAGLAWAAAVPPAVAQGVDATAALTPDHAAPARYRVINLGSGTLAARPSINASGQVAYALYDGQAFHSRFFDGRQLRSIQVGDGGVTIVTGLNDRGQVIGYGNGAGERYLRAFRWTEAAGMLYLGSLDGGDASALAINGRGEVVGFSGGVRHARHAFRWAPERGMEDLSTLANDVSSALALNDSGFISGFSDVTAFTPHAFVWTRSKGMADIGTLGGDYSSPVAIGALGQVAGNSAVADPVGASHAFLWTQAGGMRDLGAMKGHDSYVAAMNPQAQIVGSIHFDSGVERAMAWSAASGMIDLSSFGGAAASARHINGKGQIVGYAQDQAAHPRAFLWNARRGLADLNERIVNAPAGLVVDDALSIADNGSIVATSNAGLVLLRPLGAGTGSVAGPTVGPITFSGPVRAGQTTSLKVAFNDSDTKQLHHASIQWGDAMMETALVDERSGNGSAAAGHVYQAPGIYTVIATVADSAGRATATKRDLVVDGSSQRAAGSGRLMLPQGANHLATHLAGPASFSLLVPAATPTSGSFRFNTLHLTFDSISMSAPLPVQGALQAAVQVAGAGTLNGKGGYRYTVALSAATPAAGSEARLGLRIWHRDAVTGADVVDFDNQQAGTPSNGTAVMDGTVAVTP